MKDTFKKWICILIARGVAKASLLWKQIKAGGLGAALSPSPPMGTERSPGGGPGGARKLASFQHFKHLILSIQKKEFNPNF